MNREDIIRMAQQTGWDFGWEMTVEQVCEFAALVAAAERERVTQWMIKRGYATGHGDTTDDLLQELAWQIDERISSEREECAKIAWERFGTDGREIAGVIRARGEQ